MLPFASPCLSDNIIPISEASNKNPKFKFFFNKYFVCFLAHFSTTSYVGNKVQPIIQSSFHQGSNILTQKFKIQKKKTTTTPRYRLYYTVVTNQGDLYPNLQQISGKVNQLVSKFYTGTSKLTHKSHNRRREMAALAAVLDKRWVAQESHGQEPELTAF